MASIRMRSTSTTENRPDQSERDAIKLTINWAMYSADCIGIRNKTIPHLAGRPDLKASSPKYLTIDNDTLKRVNFCQVYPEILNRRSLVGFLVGSSASLSLEWKFHKPRGFGHAKPRREQHVPFLMSPINPRGQVNLLNKNPGIVRKCSVLLLIS